MPQQALPAREFIPLLTFRQNVTSQMREFDRGSAASSQAADLMPLFVCTGVSRLSLPATTTTRAKLILIPTRNLARVQCRNSVGFEPQLGPVCLTSRQRRRDEARRRRPRTRLSTYVDPPSSLFSVTPPYAHYTIAASESSPPRRMLAMESTH